MEDLQEILYMLEKWKQKKKRKKNQKMKLKWKMRDELESLVRRRTEQGGPLLR